MYPESLPFGGSGLKGDFLRRRGMSCRDKGLAGAARTVSRQGSCWGSSLRPLCSSWSWPWHCSSSLELRSYSGSPPLPCLVWWCPWLRLSVHSYRGTKSVPLFLYTDRIPLVWATHKRNALLGQAQKWCVGRRRGFYRGRILRALRFPRLPCVPRRGDVRVTWAACVGRFPHACVTSQ